jgi:hypothetical protein
MQFTPIDLQVSCKFPQNTLVVLASSPSQSPKHEPFASCTKYNGLLDTPKAADAKNSCDCYMLVGSLPYNTKFILASFLKLQECKTMEH